MGLVTGRVSSSILRLAPQVVLSVFLCKIPPPYLNKNALKTTMGELPTDRTDVNEMPIYN